MPLSAGMLLKKALNAFSPPADAPIPTIKGGADEGVNTGETAANGVDGDLRGMRGLDVGTGAPGLPELLSLSDRSTIG